MSPTPAHEDVVGPLCSTFSTYNILQYQHNTSTDPLSPDMARIRLRQQCETVSNLLAKVRPPLLDAEDLQDSVCSSKMSLSQAVALEHFLSGKCSLRSKEKQSRPLCTVSMQSSSENTVAPGLGLTEVLRHADMCCESFTQSITAHFKYQTASGKVLNQRYVSNHRRKILHHITTNRLPWLLTNALAELRGRLIEMPVPSPANNFVFGTTQDPSALGPVEDTPEHCISDLEEFASWNMRNSIKAVNACDALEDIISSAFTKYGNTLQALNITKPYVREVTAMYLHKGLKTPTNGGHRQKRGNDSLQNPELMHPQLPSSPSENASPSWTSFCETFRSRCIPGRVNILTQTAVSFVFGEDKISEALPLHLRSRTFRVLMEPIRELVRLAKGIATSIHQLNQADMAHNSLSTSTTFLVLARGGDSRPSNSTMSTPPVAIRLSSYRTRRRFNTPLTCPSRSAYENEFDHFDDAASTLELPVPHPNCMAPEISDFLLDSTPGEVYRFQNSYTDIYCFGVVLESLLASVFGFSTTNTYDPVHPTTPVGQKIRRRPDFLRSEYQPFDESKISLRKLIRSYFHGANLSLSANNTGSFDVGDLGKQARRDTVIRQASLGRTFARRRSRMHGKVSTSANSVDITLEAKEFECLGSCLIYSVSCGFTLLQDSERIIEESLAKSAKVEDLTKHSILHFGEENTVLQRFTDPVSFAAILAKSHDVDFNMSSLTAIHNSLKNVVDCSILSRKVGCKLVKLVLQCCQDRPNRRPTALSIIHTLEEIESDLAYMCGY